MAKPGPQKTNFEAMPARFPKGTLQRIDGVLVGEENRSDFIRTAIEREVRRRSDQSSSACKGDGGQQQMSALT
jgi:metal-responsive CopG/Arc/MetJ family transcriptional regulator